MCLVGVVFILMFVAEQPADAGNAFCDANITLPHCTLIGSAHTPGPCDIRGPEGSNDCMWDSKSVRWVDVKNKPELRKVLEERNAAKGAVTVDAPFGRTRLQSAPTPEK